MSWNAAQQHEAEQAAQRDATEFWSAMEAWKNQTKVGQTDAGKAVVENVLAQWNSRMQLLKTQTEDILSNGAVDQLGVLAQEVIDSRQELASLQGQAITSADQADSVNPKTRPSVYTNMLGLNRIFTSTTWWWIIFATIIFGLLALAAGSLLVYQIFYGGSQPTDTSVLSRLSGATLFRQSTGT